MLFIRSDYRLFKRIPDIAGDMYKDRCNGANLLYLPKDYGCLGLDQANRLKEVEKENTRLRKLAADLSLDKAILKEAAEGKY
jgi:hypothetical protein